MTEQKKHSERMSLQDYWAVTEEETSPQNFSSHKKYEPSRRGNQVRKDAGIPHTIRRVVTNPDADPATAWGTFTQRKRERSWERAKSEQKVKSVPRTLAQTGAPATHGRARIPNRPLPDNKSIPRRSSQHNGRSDLIGKVLVLFGLGGIVIISMIFALTSQAFRISRVDIVGTHDSDVIQSIQHMGIQGQNIFLLDVTGLTKRIDALPQVASSDLSKQWPNGVVIHIVERVPVLLWQTPQGTYSVDGQGVVIALVSESTGVNTVIDLTSQSSQRVKTQQRRPRQIKQVSTLHPGMQLNRDMITFAAKTLKLLPQMVGVSTFKLYYDGTMYTDGIRRQWEEGPDSRGSYLIESPSGWKAYLGSPDDTNPLSNKLIELHEILTLTQRQQLNVATIDLRYGVHPVFTLKS
jgi:cell division septal protein FtsQ